MPGLPDFTTHGNNDAFGIGWSANLPDLPYLSVQYQLSHSAYSIYGTDSDGSSAAHSLTLRSGYEIAGFNLSGGYSHAVASGDVPLILTSGSSTATSDVNNDTWNFNASHRLPMRGNFSADFERYSTNYDYFNGSRSTGNNSSDNITTMASIQPWEKVSVSGSLSFDDNLGGTVAEQVLTAGGTTQQILPIMGTHSLSMAGTVNYQPFDSLSVSGEVQRRVQSWMGANFGVTSYTGLTRYMHKLLGGGLSASMSGTGNREDNSPGTVVGFSDAASYSRAIGGWNIGVGFGYSQNIQTLLVTYMTSSYNVGGTLQKKFGPIYWTAGANTNRTGLTLEPGEDSISNSYSTGFSTGKWFGASASYQESSGIAIQTIGGLTPVPINPIINPEALVFYGGHSYSFAASTSPVRRFALAANYSRSISNTTSSTLNSRLSFEQAGITTHYQWRQVYFVGGYSRFLQGVSVAGLPASNLNSFYVGVNRWFNWF